MKLQMKKCKLKLENKTIIKLVKMIMEFYYFLPFVLAAVVFIYCDEEVEIFLVFLLHETFTFHP